MFFKSRCLYTLIFLVLAIILIVPILAACGSEEPGIIEGKISDGDTLLVGAIITMMDDPNFATTTDSAGQFSFVDVEPGNHVIVISWEGVEYVQPVKLKSGETKQLDLNLK